MVKYPKPSDKGTMILKSNNKCICPIGTHRVKLEELREMPDPKEKITSPEKASELLDDMVDYDRESFIVAHLDTKNRIVGIEEVSKGTLDASLIHPREALKGAILNNAKSVIFAHNHPSGDCTPSEEDKKVFRKLEDAFDMIGINVLDNFIIAKECYRSIKFGNRTQKK